MNRRHFATLATGGLFLPPAYALPSAIQSKWPKKLQLIPRSAWGSQAVAKPDQIEPMNGVERITIHHDGMPMSSMKTENQIRTRVTSIRVRHSKIYADIGYHFVIDPLGRVWEGRPLTYQGAQVHGQNEHNLGVMVLGNFQGTDQPSDKALATLFTLVPHLMQHYEVETKKVYTHREIGQSSCPGKNLQAEVVKARQNGGPLSDRPRAKTYRVKKGDTAYGISKRYGVDWKELLKLNGLDDPRKLRAGATILIP